ncbi:glycosyltransferase family 2 protein [Ruania alkalisoli]|uniref:Glycosyltransferase family 2 protein n=1 Tax=Ruania alkalisoli TaxID=2779775 RepID=A0A7M1SQD6_9MICO|nr:glycosyltransferase family 2 protein [Ruania alkalisoli]QOR69760.1 glycosyltransferase family 2 protein [Ruania alkalisoli]
MPLVSVIMPVYDAIETVEASIRSVQDQSHTDWELLITDDASTDGSWELVQQLAAEDARIKPARAEVSGGAARARNAAIDRAQGSYVAFLDADDQWLPGKLDRQLAFAAGSDAPLTFTAYYKVAADFDGAARDFDPTDRVVHAPAQVDYRTMLQQNHIGCLTAMYDVRQLGLRRMPDLRKRQDYGLWLSILRDAGHARGLDEPLALYREAHPGSLSGGNRLRLVRYNWQLYREVEGLSVPRSVWALGQVTVRSTLKRHV